MVRAVLKIVIPFLCCTLLYSCKKEESNSPVDLAGKKVFIVCEGVYQSGNASLSVYFPEKDSVFDNVYGTANSASLGDVFQSMTEIDSNYFLCINNSDKILVLSKNLNLRTSISVAKPRYILRVNKDKAYVSSIYTNKVFILGLASLSIKGSIDLPALNSEGMLLHDNKVYVCPWDTASDKVYVVNVSNDKVEDSFAVAGRAPSEILLDKENKLWILSGNVAKGKAAYLTRMDPDTKQILKVYSFPAMVDPVKPVMNSAKDSLYFIEVNYSFGSENNGIYRMAIHAPDLPSEPFIAAQAGQYFWALGINPLRNEIYVGDPKGFTQKSAVMIFDTKGNKKKHFSTGVGVGHFYFAN